MHREILENIIPPHAEESMPLRWIFQYENDLKHTAKLVKNWLNENHIAIMSCQHNFLILIS